MSSVDGRVHTCCVWGVKHWGKGLKCPEGYAYMGSLVLDAGADCVMTIFGRIRDIQSMDEWGVYISLVDTIRRELSEMVRKGALKVLKSSDIAPAERR
jgi:hypothetical protein